MLYLNQDQIQQAVSREELLAGVEQTLLEQACGDYFMPPRMHLERGANTLLLMPCLTEHFYGTKLVTIIPANAMRNLPTVGAVMVLNSAATGETLAILDGGTLTALRTGAVGGLGIRLLARTDTERLGIVGTGVQGFQQALFAAATRPITEIQVFGRRPEGVAILVKKLTVELPAVTIRAATSIETLLEFAQTIITATSSSEPVLPDNAELLKGRLFVGIGSYKPTMREFPESLFHLAERIFVDTDHALKESGDLVVPLAKGWISRDQIHPLGQLLMEKRSSPSMPGETVVFKSVGMALLDVCIAGLIYAKSLEKGLGQRLG